VRSLVTRARQALKKLIVEDGTMADDLLPEPSTHRVHHVANGDSTRVTLERSGVAGTISVQADPLLEGPCPPLDGPAWWAVRGKHLAEGSYGDASAEDIAAGLERWDRQLATDSDEVVLWFEHDLYDQLLLVRLLAHYRREPPPARLSLVCIGEHPAVPAFKGLGELTPDQLASLYETRAPITSEMLALGDAAWTAYREPDPRALERFLERDLTPLPFLQRALRRHLEEYPALGDGLTRTERNILRLVADGVTDPLQLWQTLHTLEDAHYVADSWLLRILRALTAPPAALLTSSGPIDLRAPHRPPLALTPLGREVLAGRQDWLTMAPIDRWLGGVHLIGSAQWRWDPLHRCLAPFTPPVPFLPPG
jgi:hypothetical protein